MHNYLLVLVVSVQVRQRNLRFHNRRQHWGCYLASTPVPFAHHFHGCTAVQLVHLALRHAWSVVLLFFHRVLQRTYSHTYLVHLIHVYLWLVHQLYELVITHPLVHQVHFQLLQLFLVAFHLVLTQHYVHIKL